MRPAPILLLLALLPIQPLQASNDWSLCRIPLYSPATTLLQDSAGGVVLIEADRLFSLDGRILEFGGEVSLSQPPRLIEADRLLLDRGDRHIEAEGPLIYRDRDLRLEAGRLQLWRDPDRGQLDQVRFTLAENHLQGQSENVQLLSEQRSRFNSVRYSTCDPGHEAWSLSASRLDIDRESGRGTAINSVLRLGGLPVFYLPWMQFPIDDRRLSGLLVPTFESSERNGSLLRMPIYWNLAPNYDMTLTPFRSSRRGTGLETETRYLFAGHSGQLDLVRIDDRAVGHHRWLERWRHRSELPGGIQARLLYQKVSDSDYLEDFEPPTTGRPLDWLKSELQLSARPLGWQASLLYDRYQALNLSKPVSARPYERWPQLRFDRQFSDSQARWSLDWKNQWTSFRHESNLQGERLWVTPTLGYRRESAAGYLQASLRLDLAEYRLEQALNGEREPGRSVPIASLDSGLVFERLVGDTREWRQTLEPRLYLLHVPYREQGGLPRFDSSLLPETLDNLFVDNRFSGGDRVGDTQQISLSLGSRLYDDDNREVLSLTLAQARWLEPRRVSLNGQTDRRERSPLMTRLRYAPNTAWTLELTSAYDQDADETAQGEFALRHRQDGRVLNLEYHLRRDKLEQSTISLVYPLTAQWQLFAKRQYSVRRQMLVENLAGLAWQSCCWGFKLLYREAADRDFTEIDRSVLFQLTLKGLGSAGQRIDSIAEAAILGYHPAF